MVILPDMWFFQFFYRNSGFPEKKKKKLFIIEIRVKMILKLGVWGRDGRNLQML